VKELYGQIAVVLMAFTHHIHHCSCLLRGLFLSEILKVSVTRRILHCYYTVRLL